MDNEIKPYCEYCKFNGTLGCQSTLICKDGNRLLLNTTLPAWQEKIIRQLYNIIMDEKEKRNKEKPIYEDFFVIGGRRNSKGVDALVDLFKKIEKKKVQAAYRKAYNESIIYATSQPTNRTALDEWAYDINEAMKKDEF